MSRIVGTIRARIPQTIVMSLFLAALIYLAMTTDIRWSSEGATAPPPAATVEAVQNPMSGHEELPSEGRFEQVAETDTLVLRVDPGSGHFMVTDKRSGNLWHSYPNPEHWKDETIGGIWKDHLRSPVMIQTLDFTRHNARPELTNWISANGAIRDYEPIEGGVRLTYAFTDVQVSIPVEIRIRDDYIETKIVNERIQEAKNGLLSVRLFPFFGAEHSVGQDGYLFIPDGSGAIMNFSKSSRNKMNLYKEPIYGPDFAYRTDESSRHMVRMPVFGMKSGDNGFLSIVEGGEEYADIVASPAGVYSLYNWIGTEMRYRSPFEQVTNRHRETSYLAYDEERRFGSDRVVRYYVLTGEQSTYAGMASRYRQYLMEEQGYERIVPEQRSIPLQVSLIGGDREEGLFMDAYVPMTTSSQAMEIVNTLYGMGVERMSINLLGWQKDGFTSFGDVLPVDSRLGGNEGVRHFVDFAHSLGFPVSYGVNYVLNNSGAHGFSSRHSAMRDMSGTIMNFEDWYENDLPMASLRFVERYFDEDLREISKLGFDGVTFGHGYGYGGGLGQWLISDFNTRYGSSRSEAMALQAQFYRQAAERFSTVNASYSAQYVNAYADHIFGMVDDYSYDLFSNRAVPFMQIALHGLLTYSSRYVNDRGEYQEQFLRDLEYGALPSFAFTHEPTHRMNDSYSLRMFSTQYEDWAEKAVQQYQAYNEAQRDLQDRFIVNHRSLANDVFETTYENGTRIVVNYGSAPYAVGTRHVEARGYLIVKGSER
ncbi:hypothetical protein FE782_13250 [Paenibacillus antri]|uniref:Uncharacterized protein n=1 Tax=Paenibacillus antri TaxID=2582848 RepID=A0A5R9G9T7_9BACL|nr:DUF5696 domain-containing protein [Paenibacillus antri]TLS51869.1 hypothetical protein FE782_13250 [Paenibacillus antri]